MAVSANQFHYHTLAIDQIWPVQPLWEKLNAHDASLSTHFREEFLQHNFQQRKAEFLEKSRTCAFHILLVSTAHDGRFVAYAITSLTPEKHGEIENLFVDEAHRGAGIGTELMRRTLAWLDENGAATRTVSVMFGNEAALHFYARFHFYPRTATLVQATPSAPRAAGGFQFYTAGIDQIDLIQPLWEQLAAHQSPISTYFSDPARPPNFQRRKAGIIQRNKISPILIDLASLPGAQGYIAYCVTFLSPDGHGEIDSIFVAKSHRATGIGTALMHRSLAWLDSQRATHKSVNILIENEPAIRFYARFGFHPRTATLMQKTKSA